MVIFKDLLYKNPIGQNKNGKGSYPFSQDSYYDGYSGYGHNLSSNIPQGDDYYDAARRNMGEPWMMFTKEQGQELIDNTDSEWTSINNINGKKFINKNNTSKYIFIPAGGIYMNSSHSWTNTDGLIWCVEINPSNTALGCILSVDSRNPNQMSYYDRPAGYPIRGIRI